MKTNPEIMKILNKTGTEMIWGTAQKLELK